MDEDKVTKVDLYDFMLDDAHEDIEHKLAHLLAENVIFCNNGWWYEKDGKFWPKDYITLHVNCNDVFAWACADSEDVTYGEISELYKMFKKDPNYGPAAWCIKKRKRIPQLPVAKKIIDAGIWNLVDLIKDEK